MRAEQVRQAAAGFRIHHLRKQMHRRHHHRHAQSALEERLARLQAHVAAAQHYRVRRRRRLAAPIRNRCQVFGIAQREHAREIRAGDGKPRRPRAGRENEAFESEFVAVIEHQRSHVGFEPRRLAPAEDMNA